MLLSPDIEITRYDENQYILHNGKKRYFVINEDLFHLVELLKQAETLEGAYRAYLSENGNLQTFEDFKAQIDEFLRGKEILANDGEPTEKKRHQSVRLRVTLIPEKIAGPISNLLAPLYGRTGFFAAFTVSLIATILFLMLFDKSVIESSVSGSDLLKVLVIFTLSVFLHELGHVSACKKFGGQYGGIGIGIYFILPVFWADIHGIWMLPKKERVIANLAGIYVQVLMSFVLLVIFAFTQKMFLLYSAYLISSAALFQLWPFLRLDGYWCFSDLTNTPKLTNTSVKELKQFFKEVLSENRVNYLRQMTTERVLLIGYSATFFMIILILLISFLTSI